MNPQDNDHPDLTAYALGELAPAEAEHVRRLLTQSPEARAEFERIQQTIGFLQDAPALPKRTLNPRQRETVLAMGQVPVAAPAVSRPKKVVPFLGFRRPAGSGTYQPSLAWRLTKIAAAVGLVTGAYMLGQRTASHLTPYVANQETPKSEAPNVVGDGVLEARDRILRLLPRWWLKPSPKLRLLPRPSLPPRPLPSSSRLCQRRRKAFIIRPMRPRPN